MSRRANQAERVFTTLGSRATWGTKHIQPTTSGHSPRRGCKPEPLKIRSFQLRPGHQRIQVDHLAVALEGVAPSQQDMPPGCRFSSFNAVSVLILKDFHKWRRFKFRFMTFFLNYAAGT
jgi:hypothetical protein